MTDDKFRNARIITPEHKARLSKDDHITLAYQTADYWHWCYMNDPIHVIERSRKAEKHK